MFNSKTFSDITNGALSSSFVVFVTQPFQVVRTSMMVTYKDGKINKMTDVLKKIKKEEGLHGFYRGFVPALLKTTIGSAIYFGLLEQSKDFLSSYHIDEKLKHTNENIFKNNYINFISSAFSRCIQCIVVSPILIIKTRYEVVGFNSYNSVFDALVKIKRDEGFGGYFKGLKQTLIKDVPSSAIFYSLYEFFKKVYLHNLNILNLQLQATLASISANIIITFLTNPIDVIRTRIQYLHFSKNDNHNYKGIVSGIMKIAADEGIRGLCVGIVPKFLKKAIGSTIIWTSYETLKLRSQKKREIFDNNKNKKI